MKLTIVGEYLVHQKWDRVIVTVGLDRVTLIQLRVSIGSQQRGCVYVTAKFSGFGDGHTGYVESLDNGRED